MEIPRWLADEDVEGKKIKEAKTLMSGEEMDCITIKEYIDLEKSRDFKIVLRANTYQKFSLSPRVFENPVWLEGRPKWGAKNLPRLAPQVERLAAILVPDNERDEFYKKVSDRVGYFVDKISSDLLAANLTKRIVYGLEVLRDYLPESSHEDFDNAYIWGSVSNNVFKNDENLNSSNVFGEIRGGMIDIKGLNTILEGVAGCGKTHYLSNLLERKTSETEISFKPENSEIVVFHPSTSYEDFVSGLRPQSDGTFLGEAGIFVGLCNRAAKKPEENFLLFIDEINRANTARVLGDLMMVIEDSKRTSAAELTEKRAVVSLEEKHNNKYKNTVRLQTPVSIDGNSYGYLAVPDNLYIVGTMNSTDRSVGTIDLALRRRFTWHTMEPFSTKGDFKSEKIADNCDDLIDWFLRANKTLHKEVGPDARLGHSYFFGKDKSAEQVAHDLLKQLAEIAYIFHLDDLITKEPLNESVEGWKVEMQGAGLGQRPVVVKASQPDDVAPEEDKQEEQTAEGTVEQVTEAE